MVKRLVILFLLFSGVWVNGKAQSQKNQSVRVNNVLQPRLVVGLVIDQMRWDYLYKFRQLYVTGGFNRLMGEGFNCDNTMITHLPTYTAVGHTGIYTGSFPSVHGIVGNNWYDRASGKSVYCTDDSTVTGVGSDNDAGKMSPRNMLTTTVTDQLRLSNNFKSKVIGISLKDRGAILPAGHTANAAYWFDDKEGLWISSTFYMKSLPDWVSSFNDRKLPDEYLSKDWQLLLPQKDYAMSTGDDMSFEGNIPGIKAATFPYHLGAVKEKKYRAFRFTPFANTFTLQFAKQAIDNEKLGMSGVTDFLAVSLSSTDYIGHTFGPNSLEIEDTYLRLDRDIEDFLKYLDNKIGKGNYILFLTADHGVAHNPDFLKDNKIPAGNYDTKELTNEVNDSLSSLLNSYGCKVDHIENAQLYMGRSSDTAKSGIKFSQTFQMKSIMTYSLFSEAIIALLEQKKFISHAVDLRNLGNASLPEPLVKMMKNSFFPKRSGDIQYIPNPSWLEGNGKGTTHGLWNPYDAHIPLIWFGGNIKPGKSHREVHMCDIAPTISALLDIQMPNGCMGEVIEEVVK